MSKLVIIFYAYFEWNRFLLMKKNISVLISVISHDNYNLDASKSIDFEKPDHTLRH